MALSKIRDIDSTFKNIVFQYIRQNEKENQPLKIPMMLKYLCLQFYLIQEFAASFVDNSVQFHRVEYYSQAPHFKLQIGIIFRIY